MIGVNTKKKKLEKAEEGSILKEKASVLLSSAVALYLINCVSLDRFLANSVLSLSYASRSNIQKANNLSFVMVCDGYGEPKIRDNASSLEMRKARAYGSENEILIIGHTRIPNRPNPKLSH